MKYFIIYIFTPYFEYIKNTYISLLNSINFKNKYIYNTYNINKLYFVSTKY